MSYQAPIREIAFALEAAADLGRLRPLVPGLDPEMVSAVLEAAGELASGVLAPLNRTGDRQGSRLENGKVVTPEGFAEAYRAFAEGGWNGLSADPAFGGQGLPKALELAVFEMVNGANMAFALCPTLTQAAIEVLQRHGTDRQKQLYLPRLVSGEWPGTMHLTEPQAGTDLGAIRTLAEPDGQGGYRLTGQKIFITWGDHDMAPNIVHLILARTPDAPAGVRGLSLFVASRQELGEDGALGAANALRPASLEHKLGIHASPTCVMLYEGARAELLGELHQGLSHMFIMMNAARVMVGVQGVGIAEAACQQALAYARDRRQGRSPWSEAPSALIFDHPDVRRMLALARVKTAAARAICFSAGVAADLARLAPSQADRRKADRRAQLLTPIAKAWSTDVGVEAASLGVQIHGGMGYIEETGAAQFYRDARIAPIYEGTNGVQAVDLVGRKLAMDDGEAVSEVLGEMQALVPQLDGPIADRLAAGLDAVGRASQGLAKTGGTAALAGAASYLKLFGDVLGGALLCKGALAAAAGDDSAWARDRAAVARFYAEQVLTGAPAVADAALAGDEALRAMEF